VLAAFEGIDAEAEIVDLLAEIGVLLPHLVAEFIDTAAQLPHLILEQADPIEKLGQDIAARGIGRGGRVFRAAEDGAALAAGLLQCLEIMTKRENLVLQLDGLAALHLGARGERRARQPDHHHAAQPHPRHADHPRFSAPRRFRRLKQTSPQIKPGPRNTAPDAGAKPGRRRKTKPATSRPPAFQNGYHPLRRETIIPAAGLARDQFRPASSSDQTITRDRMTFQTREERPPRIAARATREEIT
jgi:hypothetical protein